MRRQPEDHGLNPDGRSDEDVRSGGGAAAARDFANSFTRAEALRTPALYMIVLAFGLGGVGIGAMLLQTIPFLTDEGFSRTTAALMSTTMSVPALVSKPAWGWLMDLWDARVLAAAGFLMSGVAMVVIVLAAKEQALVPLVAGFLLMGWGFGGQIPLQETIWASYFGRRHLGAVRSVAMPFSLVLGAGGPLAVSFYFDVVGNYDGAFFAIGAMWALAAVLVLLVRRPRKPVAVVIAEGLSSRST
jgi:MFS family permease